MEKLTEKKRKWIIHQFRSGRSATSVARIQKVSRQMVYQLAAKYKDVGSEAYVAKKPGRPRLEINNGFRSVVKEIREDTDYGSQKIHFVLNQRGYSVSQRQIQKVLNEQGLTKPCPKRRGQRKYIRYQWPISNCMWHTDWSEFNDKYYSAYLDDRSRKIMAAGEFDNETCENSLFLLYQGMLTNNVCPIIVLSDKGTQFYNSKRNKKGERPPGQFEQKLEQLGIDFWTSRRRHPQTNGKMEKWFDTMKKRLPKHENLQDFVRWYNEERIHYSLKYETPENVYREKL